MDTSTNNIGFIEECEKYLEFMKETAADDPVITEGLIDSYEENLDELIETIEKFRKVLAKGNNKLFSNANISIPLPVHVYYALRSSFWPLVFGSFLGLGSSAVLGGLNPELWSPTLMLISAGLGLGTATPIFIAEEKKMFKYYKSGKYKGKKFSLTKQVKKLSKEEQLDAHLARSNSFMNDDQILQYIDQTLSNGLSKKERSQLSEEKPDKATKLMTKMMKLKGSLARTNAFVKNAMDANNIPVPVATKRTKPTRTDDLAISTDTRKPSNVTKPEVVVEPKPKTSSTPKINDTYVPITKKKKEAETPDIKFVPIASKKSHAAAAKDTSDGNKR